MDFAQTLKDGLTTVRTEAVRLWRELDGWHLALFIALGLLILVVILPAALALAILALMLAFVAAWVHDFVTLMRLEDEVFPGRYDKAIWALLLIVLPPIGMLAFWSYRKLHGFETKRRPFDIFRDLL